MKFSVIIPVYNSEKTIKRALHSVQNQNYKNFEVLIIDDGSSDNTANICKEFVACDTRFKYHFQTNKGVSVARNNGIANASGEFIVFLDSDDAYSSHFLSALDEATSLHGDCNNFWCDYAIVEDNSKAVDNGDIIMSTLNFGKLNRNDANILPALWNKAFRRSIIEKINLQMPEDMSLGEDFIFNYKYLDASGEKIIYISEKLYLYTKATSTSLDGKYRSDLINIFEKLENEMFAHYKKWNLREAEFSKYYSYVFNNRIKILYETYRTECPLSKTEKRKHNKAILKCPKFREALNNATWHIHPLYKLAYRLASWRLIQLLDKLVNLKGKMR